MFRNIMEIKNPTPRSLGKRLRAFCVTLMMMVMVMVTMMVNVCDDDFYLLVMKVILVKELMSCDVSPVAMFLLK